MEAKTFLAEFGHIAFSRGGVSVLRKLVLDLAVRGQLQLDRAGESSEVMPSLIRGEEIREKVQGRRRVALSPVDSAELKFAIPPGWDVARLGDICEVVRGITFSASEKATIRADGSAACIRTTNVQAEVDWRDLIYVDESLVKRDSQWLSRGDTVISMANSYELVGKVALVRDIPTKATFGGFLAVIRSTALHSGFLFLVMRSPYMQTLLRAGSSQTTNIANISLAGMRPIPVPVPPINVQSGIVAKVDELMALCDKLEAQQQQRDELRAVTRMAACRDLAGVRRASGLPTAWQRVRSGMGLWMDVPESVGDVEQALGYMGCRGLLTGEGFPLAEGADDERPALPQGWRWMVLGDLAEYITSGSRGWRQYLAAEGDVFIRSQDIKHDELRFEDRAFVALPEKAEGKRTLVRTGDLLMTITGANVGKCAQMPELAAKAYVSQHVALVRVKDVRHTPFLHFWLTNAYGGRKHLARFIYGDKPGLNLPQVAGIPVPLPPQDVQDRIVESLRHYGTICNRLTQQLRDARKLAQALAQSSVDAITGFNSEDRTPMKTPKTELVSNLQLSATPPAAQDIAPLAALLAKHPAGMSAKALWSASALEIDVFYQQLKTEMARGWIVQPEPASVREVAAS